MVVSFALVVGTLAVLFAISLNTASMMNQRQGLQALADKTALSLAVEINVLSQSKVDLSSVALSRINDELISKGDTPLQSGEVTVRTLRTEPLPHAPSKSASASTKLKPSKSSAAPDDTIEVVIETYPTPSPAMSAVNQGTKPIRVTSRALRLGASNLCVIALHPSRNFTVLMRHSTRMTAPNCDIVSNSTNASGVVLSGSARLEAREIHSAGGALGDAVHYSPAPVTDSLTLPDPLSTIPEPPDSPCSPSSGMWLTGPPPTVYPAIHCSGLRVSSGNTVRLLPGIHTFDEDVIVEAGGTLVADGATIHLTDDAQFSAQSGSSVRMTAPITGSTAGILLFESRDHSEDLTHSIQTTDARYMVGTIYLPRGVFHVSTTAPVSDQSEYTAIVARRLVLYGNSNLFLNTDYHATPVPTPAGIGPIEGGVRIVE